MANLISQVERRRRNLRIVLFIIIIATLPFYCAGFLLWGTAPARQSSDRITITATFTPLATILTPSRTVIATITPLGTQLSPLLPTPIQFFTPIGGGSGGGNGNPFPPTATFPVFIPTSTFAPTLTPLPTNTPIPPPTLPPPPSDTPIPIPSDTPIPIMSDTPVPIPSDTPFTVDMGTVEPAP